MLRKGVGKQSRGRGANEKQTNERLGKRKTTFGVKNFAQGVKDRKHFITTAK
jgi:hypothetical protein